MEHQPDPGVCCVHGVRSEPHNTREILGVKMVWNLKRGNCFCAIGPIRSWAVKLQATESQVYKHEHLLRSQLSPQADVKCVFLADSLENSKFPTLVQVSFLHKKTKNLCGVMEDVI